LGRISEQVSSVQLERSTGGAILPDHGTPEVYRRGEVEGTAVIDMPASYIGREQTFLKHRVLHEYLAAWAQKMASHGAPLWYVDCFAGPWESADTERKDTSISVALSTLNEATASWAGKKTVATSAVFVEKNGAAYAALESFLPRVKGIVNAVALRGEFGAHVDEIDRMVGDAPAFIFVDPTGWDGAAMKFIAKLARGRHRDVLVNVMYDHLNRFKDDQRRFLRDQMHEFFGLDESLELETGLAEDGLMRFYRERLKAVANLPFVADLAVPVPHKDRTNFRLVVGGHHPAVVKLFRDVEKKVMGVEAGGVRGAAREREKASRTPEQSALFEAPHPPTDRRYEELRAKAERDVRQGVPVLLRKEGSMRYGELWPRILCACHMSQNDLNVLLLKMRDEGLITVAGISARERSLKDHHHVRLPDGGAA
jgi:three-Cys-motif partner protein